MSLLSHFISESFSLFPFPRKEIDHRRDGVAVGGETVAEDEAVEAPTEKDSEKPAETDTENNAVKNGKYHTKTGVADTLNESAASSHHGEGREHPEDCTDKFL